MSNKLSLLLAGFKPTCIWRHEHWAALCISFDDISLCNYRIILKMLLKYRYRVFFWKYLTILILRHALWKCVKCPLKIKMAWLFPFWGHTFSMYLHTLCHFFAFDAFNVYDICITHACHAFRAFFVKNFALIMSHEISLISCDYRMIHNRSSNIVRIQEKDIAQGWLQGHIWGEPV